MNQNTDKMDLSFKLTSMWWRPMYIYRKWQLSETNTDSLSRNESRGEETELDDSQYIWY